MEVRITDKYRAKGTDSTDYKLECFKEGGEKVRNVKTGEDVLTKDRWETVGYFPNIKQCVARTVDDMLRNGERDYSLEDYLKQARRLGEKLGECFEK